MAFSIIRNDITKVAADVIVNSANPRPICGGSTEAAIFDAAGYDELLEARQSVGYLEVGQLGVTPAFNLSARNIVHISCPWWDGENPEGSCEILASCYVAAIEKALQLGAKSMAFPLLSSGVYMFPKDVALRVAAETCALYDQVELQIVLVVYDQEAFAYARECEPDVRDFLIEPAIVQDSIRDGGVWRVGRTQPECSPQSPKRGKRVDECEGMSACYSKQSAVPKALEGFACVKPLGVKKSPEDLQLEDEVGSILMSMDDDSFQDKMLGYIDRKGMDPATVYRAANLDRKLFSKVKKEGYIPSKNTALALAVGLQLNLEEAMDLLSRANYAFSPASKRDAIIRHFIQKEDFYKSGRSHRPIDVINDCLNTYREEPLGME